MCMNGVKDFNVTVDITDKQDGLGHSEYMEKAVQGEIFKIIKLS